MAGDATLTVVGNLAGDPELRYTSNGVAVVTFTVASTPRFFDKASGSWKEGEALFLRCVAWRETAEHVAECLTKGTRVVVQGRLTQESYETREGQRRTALKLQVDEVGASLRYATVKVNRVERRSEGGRTAVDDPWAAAPTAGTGSDDPPPF